MPWNRNKLIYRNSVGEQCMDKQVIEQFRRILLQEQKELFALKESAKVSESTVDLDQSSVGRLSRIDALQSQAMAKESQRRREVQLTRIEAALERISDGEFGYCASCDEEINIKRLEVNPANPFCVDCAEKI